uniref:Ras-related GTPase n=1 Tax=Pithovirus LCPAC304 TaxID=2506594 RepID=A0A481Z872_9VIRU|nr:MAG: Ras-related GTPase [Pithovirus LCPAC304]
MEVERERTHLGNFKIVLLGDGEVGKTTWLHRHISEDFVNEYTPTLGVEVHPIQFNTNYGTITFNVWDCAGVDEYGGLRDGYYIMALGAVLMYDVTNVASHTHLATWSRDLDRVSPGIPIFVCGNKCDIEERAVGVGDVVVHPECYCDLSVASNHNVEKPFLFLARALTGHSDLVFVDSCEGVVEDPSSIPL